MGAPLPVGEAWRGLASGLACVASPVFLLVALAACVALLLLHFLRDG